MGGGWLVQRERRGEKRRRDGIGSEKNDDEAVEGEEEEEEDMSNTKSRVGEGLEVGMRISRHVRNGYDRKDTGMIDSIIAIGWTAVNEDWERWPKCCIQIRDVVYEGGFWYLTLTELSCSPLIRSQSRGRNSLWRTCSTPPISSCSQPSASFSH